MRNASIQTANILKAPPPIGCPPPTSHLTLASSPPILGSPLGGIGEKDKLHLKKLDCRSLAVQREAHSHA